MVQTLGAFDVAEAIKVDCLVVHPCCVRQRTEPFAYCGHTGSTRCISGTLFINSALFANDEMQKDGAWSHLLKKL